MNIGIFSGTFDPIHLGHQDLADQSLAAGLDKVVFMPEPQPRRKTRVSPLNDRTKMIQMIADSNPGFLVFAPTGHQKHTPAQTHKILKSEFGVDSKFVLIMGGDVFEHLPEWLKEGNIESLRKYDYYVGLRTEDDGEIAVAIRDKLKLRVKLFSSNHPTISSSAIRAKAFNHQEISTLDPTVLNYVLSKGLYDG